jgi:hypothetical protein
MDRKRKTTHLMNDAKQHFTAVRRLEESPAVAALRGQAEAYREVCRAVDVMLLSVRMRACQYRKAFCASSGIESVSAVHGQLRMSSAVVGSVQCLFGSQLPMCHAVWSVTGCLG